MVRAERCRPLSVRQSGLALSLLNLANGNLLSLELRALEADNKRQGDFQSARDDDQPEAGGDSQRHADSVHHPGTANSRPTVTFKDAFLCLLVDPQILNNDSLILTVEVQKDAVRFISGISDPAIDTKRIKTQVRVNNGETLVLGGIFDGRRRHDRGTRCRCSAIFRCWAICSRPRPREQQDRADHFPDPAHPRRASVAALIAALSQARARPALFFVRIFVSPACSAAQRDVLN
jgi:hypothetical protein